MLVLGDFALHFKNLFSAVSGGEEEMFGVWVMHVLETIFKLFLFHKQTLSLLKLSLHLHMRMPCLHIHQLSRRILPIKARILRILIRHRLPRNSYKRIWWSDRRVRRLGPLGFYPRALLGPGDEMLKVVCGGDHELCAPQLEVGHVFEEHSLCFFVLIK